jgi:hypothetical protein
LQIGDIEVGLEITTLNGFVADWIFTERLTPFLSSGGYLSDKSIIVKHSLSRIIAEFQRKNLHEYIRQVGEGITSNNMNLLQNADVDIEIETRWAGCISWDIEVSRDVV